MLKGPLLCLTVFVFIPCFLAADWPEFRGSDGTGVAKQANTPVEWSATENVVWKTAMPGFGASSPIVVGDKIILTAYSGYGLSEEELGDQKNLRLHVVCVSATNGKILWEKSVPAQLPEQGYSGYITRHGYAAPTPGPRGPAPPAWLVWMQRTHPRA